MDKDIVARLREFMENEARSCSMDPGCISPLYVYRMWGGRVALEDISNALDKVRYEFYGIRKRCVAVDFIDFRRDSANSKQAWSALAAPSVV